MNRAAAEEAILDRYPNIFPAEPDGSRLPFACGEGWFQIVEHLCATVQSYIDHTEVPVADADGGSLMLSPPQLVFDTIKEKLGTGRFYETLAPFPAEVVEAVPKATLSQLRALFAEKYEGMILFAEHLTAVTCEACGRPGELLSRKGYLGTRCPECAKRAGFKPRPAPGSPSTRLRLTQRLVEVRDRRTSTPSKSDL